MNMEATKGQKKKRKGRTKRWKTYGKMKKKLKG